MPCQKAAVPRQQYSELDHVAYSLPLSAGQNKSCVTTLYAEKETIAPIKSHAKLFREISGLGSDPPLKVLISCAVSWHTTTLILTLLIIHLSTLP